MTVHKIMIVATIRM